MARSSVSEWWPYANTAEGSGRATDGGSDLGVARQPTVPFSRVSEPSQVENRCRQGGWWMPGYPRLAATDTRTTND